MAEGFPGVERLKSGRYRARVWNPAGYNPRTKKNGRREPLEGTFPTARAAHDAKVAAENRLDALSREDGREVKRNVSPISGHVTIGELCWAWLDEQRWPSPRTRESQIPYVKEIEKYFSGMEAAKLDRESVLRWRRDQIDLGLSAHTRNARLSTLRRSLDRAVERHILPVNVAGDVIGEPVNPRQRKKGRLPTEQEFALATYFMPYWLYPALFLARDAGLRVSEVCGLQWRNVHLDDRPWIHVADTIDKYRRKSTTSKHGKVRNVPLSRDTAETLRRHRELFPPRTLNDRVFRLPQTTMSAPRDYVPCNSVWQRWEWARRAAGMEDQLPLPRFHDLRHLTGTTLMRKGVPIEDARVFMGHQDYRTLQIYVESSPLDRLHDAVARTWDE